MLVKEDERGEEVLTVDHFGETRARWSNLLDTIMLSASAAPSERHPYRSHGPCHDGQVSVDGILVSAMDPLSTSNSILRWCLV